MKHVLSYPSQITRSQLTRVPWLTRAFAQQIQECASSSDISIALAVPLLTSSSSAPSTALSLKMYTCSCKSHTGLLIHCAVAYNAPLDTRTQKNMRFLVAQTGGDHERFKNHKGIAGDAGYLEDKQGSIDFVPRQLTNQQQGTEGWGKLIFRAWLSRHGGHAPYRGGRGELNAIEVACARNSVSASIGEHEPVPIAQLRQHTCALEHTGWPERGGSLLPGVHKLSRGRTGQCCLCSCKKSSHPQDITLTPLLLTLYTQSAESQVGPQRVDLKVVVLVGSGSKGVRTICQSSKKIDIEWCGQSCGLVPAQQISNIEGTMI
eukprot:1061519-Pelagomonas_calceolata.AAC.2